jgi:hypothetical protein
MRYTDLRAEDLVGRKSKSTDRLPLLNGRPYGGVIPDNMCQMAYKLSGVSHFFSTVYNCMQYEGDHVEA